MSVRQQRMKRIMSGPTSSTEAGDDEVEIVDKWWWMGKCWWEESKRYKAKRGEKLPTTITVPLNGALPFTQ